MPAERIRWACSVSDGSDRGGHGALIEPLGAGSFPGRRFHGAQAVYFRRRLAAGRDRRRRGRGRCRRPGALGCRG